MPECQANSTSVSLCSSPGYWPSATGIGQLKLQIARLRLEELLFDQAQAAPEADRFATIKPA
ncbi:hypothetical protein ACU4GD_24250 [Cupriavidus basilensis]